MRKHKPGNHGMARWIRTIIIVAALVAAGLIGINYLLPMLTADSVTTYESYTVGTGRIETELCFSASLEVKKSETFTAQETTRVKELYVTSGETVLKGDPLVLLTDGELFTAGFDGVVNEIRYSVGDWVRERFNVVQVSDLVHLQVRMDVDEYDVMSLSVGQPCKVKVISLNEDFETVIAHIDRVSSSSGTLAYYTVTCDLTVPEKVLPGMRTMVTVPDQAITEAAVLPMEALLFDTEEQAYVLLQTDNGTYEKQSVVTGLSDGVQIEIISGVKAGDTVYAVNGTQSIEPAFSFEDLYIALTGRKVVINESQSRRTVGTEIPAISYDEGTPGPDGTSMRDSDFPVMNPADGINPVSSDTQYQDSMLDTQNAEDETDLRTMQDDQTSDVNKEP